MNDPGQQFICDASGFKFPMSEAVRQWDGALVHRRFCDKPNPQDSLRAMSGNRMPPRSRPEPADTFVNDTNPAYVTYEGVPVTYEGVFVEYTGG